MISRTLLLSPPCLPPIFIFIFILNFYFNFNPTSPIHDHAQCYTRCASILYSSLLNHPYPTTCLKKATQTLHVPFHLTLSKTHAITIRPAVYHAQITHSTTVPVEALCKNHGTIDEHIIVFFTRVCQTRKHNII